MNVYKHTSIHLSSFVLQLASLSYSSDCQRSNKYLSLPVLLFSLSLLSTNHYSQVNQIFLLCLQRNQYGFVLIPLMTKMLSFSVSLLSSLSSFASSSSSSLSHLFLIINEQIDTAQSIYSLLIIYRCSIVDSFDVFDESLSLLPNKSK